MTFALLSRPHRWQFASIVVLSLWGSSIHAADAKPIPVENVKHEGPVDFNKEILPILKKNCTACHNNAKAENKLSLESTAAILKGGSGGPGAIAKKGAESLIMTRATTAGDEQMPPAANKVGANRLTSTELGLLKLWIDQGATDTISQTERISWQPLPAGVQPIFAIALTPDGQYAACSRANQIFIYHVPSERLVTRLTDPALLNSGLYNKPGVADLDLIRSLTFSPDGKTLASGGFRTIKLWKQATDVKQPYLGGKVPAPTNLVVASPDRKQLAFVQGNDIQLADVDNQKLTQKLSGHTASVTAIAFTADGTKIVTASTDKSARVWSNVDGKLLAVVETPVELTAAAITNDGATCVVGAADGKCRSFTIPKESVADDAKLTIAQEWPTAGKRVTAMASVANNPTQIVVGDDTGNIVIWDTANVKTSIKAMQKLDVEIRALAVSPAGTKIMSLDAGSSLRAWNIADGKQVAIAKGDVRALRQIALAERNVAIAKSHVAAEKIELADAEKLATNESDAAKKAEESRITAIKVQKEKNEALNKLANDKVYAEMGSILAAELAKKAEEAKAAADAAVVTAVEAEKGAEDPKAAAANTKAARAALIIANQGAIAATAKAKAAVTAIDKTIKPLDDATKVKAEADSVVQSCERGIISAADASKRTADAIPDAKKQLEGAEAHQKKLEADLETVKKNAMATEKPFRSLAFSPDGKLLAVGGDDFLVHTFNAESAAPLDVFVGHGSPVVGVAFVDDHRLASMGVDGDALAWTLYPEWTWSRTIGDPASTEIADRVTALDFSPNGQLLASGGGAASRNGELKIWNPADGKLVREMADAHSDTVFSVKISPDGKHVASGAADKFLKVFDMATGKFVRSFEGHTHHVLGVDWSADGRLLATAGADNAVKSWGVNSGEQKKSTGGFGKEVTSIAFIGATSDVIAASGDKTVRMLKADTGVMGKQFAGANVFLYCSAVSADGQVVAAGGKDGVLRVWDVTTGTQLKTFAPPAASSLPPSQK